NNKVINIIYDNLIQSFKTDLKIEFYKSEDLNQISSIIFPLSENASIYDILSVSINKEMQLESQEEIINHNFKDNLIDPIVCKCCYKNTPKEISFCIYCSYEIKKDDIISDYQIKINKLDYESKVKLSKYFSDISSINYSDILNKFGSLPVIIELKTNQSFINEILEQLEINNISYNIIEYTIEKFISKVYNSVNLGTLENDYITKSNTKIIKETIKSIKSYDLKESITYSLYQSFQIINQLRNSEKNAFLLLKDTEKEINIILEKMMSLVKRVDKLEIYLSENSIEKLNKEIIKIQDKINILDNKALSEINKQNLELKNQELKELTKIIDNYQVLNYQIISIRDLFKSLRTKVAYINTYDIEENKGDYKELNNIKNNLISKIKAIDEVLKY
ncbi:MAG: hypothetical protein U0354_12200, partial [Candidatus Sericytochromatia bacterium]